MLLKNRNDQEAAIGAGTSIIAQGTSFTGNITSNSDLRIDGSIEGNVQSQSKVVIGKDGQVKGDINGAQVDVMGFVHGNVYATDGIILRSKARVQGNINTCSLEVERGALLDGKCQMDGSKDLANGTAAKHKLAPVTGRKSETEPALSEN